MTSVKSQRYGPRAHSTPDFSANVTPAMCRALNGEVWAEQVPNEEAQAQIQEMVDSYVELEESLDQSAQDLGVTDAVNQALQQAAAGQQEEAQEQEPEATEAAQQKAQELGVDVSEVEGTGSEGRITVKDVQSAANQG